MVNAVPLHHNDISHVRVGQMIESGHVLDGRLATLVVKRHGLAFRDGEFT